MNPLSSSEFLSPGPDPLESALNLLVRDWRGHARALRGQAETSRRATLTDAGRAKLRTRAEVYEENADRLGALLNQPRRVS